MTNLGVVFPAYASEAQAIEAFTGAAQGADGRFDSSKIRVVCIDTSKDVLAGLNALLTRAGYAVFTTRYIGEAVTLVKTTQPRVIICGPGVMAVPNAASVIDKFGQADGKLDVLRLPADFYTADAGQAGQELIAQVQALITL
jgi:DNA-binding NtrC family response regulator